MLVNGPTVLAMLEDVECMLEDAHCVAGICQLHT